MTPDRPVRRQCAVSGCQREARNDGHAMFCARHTARVGGAGPSGNAAPAGADGADAPVATDGTGTNTGTESPAAGPPHDARDDGEQPSDVPGDDGGNSDIALGDCEPETYPTDLVEHGERWLVWQETDGRKIPRNPTWGYSDDGTGYTYASAKNPDAWNDFAAAKDWVDHDDDLGLAYYLTSPELDDWADDATADGIEPPEDATAGPHVGLLDFDDVRDPETGDIAPTAAALLERLAGTFCEWSPSGTGAHALGGFRLPDDVSALTIDLSTPEWPDAELELYPGRRYTTVTRDHIPRTATSTRDIQGVVDLELEEITTPPVWDSCTWAVAVDPVQVAHSRTASLDAPPSELRAVSLAAFTDGPPPE